MPSKLVLLVVFIFDLIAFGLAIAAEQRRSTGAPVRDNTAEYMYCQYDSDISTGLGVACRRIFVPVGKSSYYNGGKPVLLLGRALKPGGSRAWPIILFIICWVFFMIAESCLLAGSVRNAYHTKYKGIFGGGDYSCETVRKGVFRAGAAFVFLTSIVSQLYYVSYSNSREGYDGEAGVGMAAYK